MDFTHVILIKRRKMKKIFSFLILFLIFFLSPSKAAFAADPIRVTGFDHPRTFDSLNDYYSDHLKSRLLDPSNFGTGGIVPCAVTFLPFVENITPGSLVQNGVRTADVFFGGTIDVSYGLQAEEAKELKKFIEAGGVVYITENGFPGFTSDYNALLEEMGIPDRFQDEVDQTYFEGESYFPIETPITNGPFGRVGNLSHGGFRILNISSMTPVARGFETGDEGGGIGTLSLQQNTSENYVLAEIKFGNGYLSATGNFLYLADWDDDNINYFLNLFAYACGIPDEVGTNLDVPLFKQTDNQWGALEYDSGNSQDLWCGSTIGQCGCATTSAAMILNYFGVDKDPMGRSTTPQTLNEYLGREQKCLSSGNCTSYGYRYGGLRWNAISEYSADVNKIFGTQKIVLSRLSDYTSQLTQLDIENGKPVILQNTAQTHWFVARGISGDTFSINDPGFNKTTLAEYGNYANAMRTYERTASDFSSFEATSKGPTQLLVTDPEGRKTGFNPETNSVVEEIPNSFYFFEKSYSNIDTPDEIAPEGEGIYTVLVNTPEHKNYKVETIAPIGEVYSFAVYASDRDGGVHFDMFEGTQPQGINEYSFSYSPESEDETKFAMEISIDIAPLIKSNIILRRFRYLIPVAILSSETFDAAQTDKLSVKFGKTGGEDSLSFCIPWHFNRDGKKDMACFFKSWETGLERGDSKAILTGKTTSGLSIYGTDSVKVF